MRPVIRLGVSLLFYSGIAPFAPAAYGTDGIAPTVKRMGTEVRTIADPHGSHSLHPSVADLPERAQLMRRAEAALARGEVERAAQDFERAGLMQHEADAELGLVRTYMQAGDYRRALSFSAHTSGAHANEPEGAAMYAWLLQLGGQPDAAKRLLKDAKRTNPSNRLLAMVGQQLQNPIALAADSMSHGSTHFIPYSQSLGVPKLARVAGTGVLIDDGNRVLVPTTTLHRRKLIWVRNGLGQSAIGIIERQLSTEGITVLRLRQPLPFPFAHNAAANEAFPGSIAYCVEYPALQRGDPAWPSLIPGFLGQPATGDQMRNLGIDLPKGPRGGPVFNGEGQLIGIAGIGRDGANVLISVPRLRGVMPKFFGKEGSIRTGPRQAVEDIYETGMRTALQIIVLP